MRLDVGNVYTRISGFDSTEGATIASVVDVTYSYFFRMRWMKRAERRERVVSFRSEFLNDSVVVPTGLIPRIKAAFPSGEIEWHITNSVWGGVVPIGFNPCLRPGTFDPKSYQSEALEAAANSWRGVLHLPTGAGKTFQLALLIDRFKVPTLILEPNLTLLKQTVTELEKFLDVPIAMVGGGSRELGDITVASAATLRNVLNEKKLDLSRWSMILADECHHVAAGPKVEETTLWYRLCMASKACYRFGLTGTVPGEGELNRIFLEAAFGPVIYSVSTTSLIEAGDLSPVDIEMRELHLSPRESSWPRAYETHILGRVCNEAVASAAVDEVGQGRSVLIPVNRTDNHGRVLQSLIPNSIYLDGSSSVNEREEATTRIENEGGALIGTVFGEGTNIPRLDTVVMAAGGKAERLTLQRVGRALRRADGKGRGKIIDFFHRDGGILEKHSRQRLKTYRSEPAFSVRVVKGEMPNG